MRSTPIACRSRSSRRTPRASARVPNQLVEFGILKQRIGVNPMIAAPAAVS
jgi:hypothetical protein